MEQVNEQVKLYLTVQRFEDQFLNEIDELGNDTNSRSHGSNQVVFFKINYQKSFLEEPVVDMLQLKDKIRNK